MYVIGLDIGGTEIKGAVVDRRGEMVCEQSIPTEALQGRERILENLFRLINQLRRGRPIYGIGIGSAGRINVLEGKVEFATSNLPGWQGLRLKNIVEERTGLPVTVDNDVHMAAQGERWKGAAENLTTFVMLTIGTGVGGAFVHRGELVRGACWSAAEWGHVVLVPGGDVCNCGLRGCLEQYLSGPALIRRARRETGREYRHGKEVFDDFCRGDPRVQEVIEGYLEDLKVALHNIQHAYDPEAIVLGGGVSESLRHPEVKRRLDQQCGKSPVPIRLIWAELGNRAGVVGSAKCAWECIQNHDLGGKWT